MNRDFYQRRLFPCSSSFLFICTVIFMVTEGIIGTPIKYSTNVIEKTNTTDLLVMDYLKKFGYLENNVDDDRIHDDNLHHRLRSSSITTMNDALKKFQDFGGIRKTGIIDNDTEKLINASRCGLSDNEYNIVPINNDEQNITVKNISKRFTRVEKLARNNLRVFLTKNSLPISSNINLIRKDLSRALNLWAKHSNLVFNKVINSNLADIRISFHKKEHGHDYPFDDRGQILTHAFLPPTSSRGIVHFDEDETWIFGRNVKDDGTRKRMELVFFL